MSFVIQSRKKLRVENKLGIHASPAVMIAKLLMQYPGLDISVRGPEEQVNARSVMGLMMLEAKRNTELLFIVEGGELTEHRSVLEELAKLFRSKFFEE